MITRRQSSVVDLVLLLRRGRDGYVLLLRRADLTHTSGLLAAPSGDRYYDETVAQGVLRTAHETLGVRMNWSEVWHCHTTDYCLTGQPHRIALVFASGRWSGQPYLQDSHNYSEIRWIDPQEPPQDCTPDTLALLHELARGEVFSTFTGR